MNELALFSGAGGGILGGLVGGWTTICAVERDAYAAQVLAQRQNDGALAPFPIWSDVCSFAGRPWKGLVDVVSAGFPCQDISQAGKGAGIEGARSGLWSEAARIIEEVEPTFVFLENSPNLSRKGLGKVLGDMASLGFDAEWCVLGADEIGANHIRKRMWILGWHPNRYHAASWSTQHEVPATDANPRGVRSDVANSHRERQPKHHTSTIANRSRQYTGRSVTERYGAWWATEPRVGRVADAVAFRVDRVRAIGNGQVPGVAALAFSTMMLRALASLHS